MLQSIDYQGDAAVTIREILERLQQRRIRLGVETLFHEEELGRAAAAIQELLAERGRPNGGVTCWAEPILPPSGMIWPPSSVKLTFRVEEPRCGWRDFQ